MAWTLLVVTLALALPASTLAINRYRTHVLGDGCSLHGGANGYGSATLSIRATEVGKSGVNHFKVVTKVQQGPTWQGPWSPYATWSDWTSAFANDSVSHYQDIFRYFSYTSDAQTKYHRIVVKIEYWSYALGLRATRTVKGKAC